MCAFDIFYNMLKIILIGALGKMGREIADLANKDKDLRIICGVERDNHPLISKEVEGIKIVSEIAEYIKQTDCIVDFSNPKATLVNLKKCADRNVPWVIGTTGFADKEQTVVLSYQKKIPILYSPNMSIGINLMFELVDKMAQRLKEGYDIEIIEMHHRYKKDAPSGTAKRLADIIRKTKDAKLIFGRQGNVGPRNDDEIGIMALRGGDVIGEHTVIFATSGERLELKHQTTNRQAFARGVIRAVKFIVKQKPGSYSMLDVIEATNHQI